MLPAFRKAKRESRALVEQTGNDYAYQFVRAGRWLVEVRVFASGATSYTRVDKSGKALGRAYAVPSPKRSVLACAPWLAVVAVVIAEKVL